MPCHKDKKVFGLDEFPRQKEIKECRGYRKTPSEVIMVDACAFFTHKLIHNSSSMSWEERFCFRQIFHSIHPYPHSMVSSVDFFFCINVSSTSNISYDKWNESTTRINVGCHYTSIYPKKDWYVQVIWTCSWLPTTGDRTAEFLSI